MGEVYLAENLRLHKRVALKFLSESVRDDPIASQRLSREARAIAELDHPNIARIYDFQEVDGRQFLVMEYLEGETLADRIRAHGRLESDEARRVICAVADGLDHAHRLGIVHRDIKSANIILLPDGTVKVLDFGLARRSEGTSLTAPGRIVGTLAYMSPEQVSGDPVDERSDIWGVGVVLYECLTGRRPFDAPEHPSIMYQILNSPLDPPSQHNPKVDPALDRIVAKCLEKEPSKRYRRAADLSADLANLDSARAISPSRGSLRTVFVVAAIVVLSSSYVVWRSVRHDTAETRPRLAVIGFVDLTSHNDPVSVASLMALLEVGLATGEGYDLVSREYLQNIQRRRLESEAGATPPNRALLIAKEAHANLMLSGEFTGDARGPHVSWRLIDVRSGSVVDAGMANAAAWTDVADRIVAQVSSRILAVAGHTGEREPLPIGERISRNPDAYRHYVAALVADENGRVADARRELLHSVDLDSTFALAYFALSRNYDPNTEMDAAQRAAQKAWKYGDGLAPKERQLLQAHQLSLDYKVNQAIQMYEQVLQRWPDCKEALVGRATTSFYFRDWNGARSSAEAALTFYPDERAVKEILAASLCQLGRWSDALPFARQLKQVSRSSGIDAAHSLGDTFLGLAQVDSAEVAYERSVVADSSDFWGLFGMSLCDYARGDLDRAIEAQTRLLADPHTSRSDKRYLVSVGSDLSLPALLADAGRIREAVSTFEDSAHFPRVRSVGRATLLVYAGWAGAAASLTDEILTTTPVSAWESAYNRSVAARVLTATGKIDAADQIRAELFQTVQDNLDIPRGFVQRNLLLAGEIAAAHDEPKRALGYLDELEREGYVRLGMDDIEAHELRSVALERAGKLNEATQVLEDLAHRFGGRALIRFHLGALYERTGHPKEAREAYAKSLSLWELADADYPYPDQVRARLARIIE